MKKWTYLVAAGMLLGATPVFTGCIDNDEPEGISILRGAKAELLKAKASVEAAKVAQIQADAALTQAQAKIAEAEAAIKLAQADYVKAKALEMQYKAELANITNEEKRAELENQIKIYAEQRAAAERKAKAEAAELEKTLLAVKTELVKQQALYEQALKNLILAQNTLTKEQQNYLQPYINAVETAKTNVDLKAEAYEKKADALAQAMKDLEDANGKESTKRTLVQNVTVAERGLEAAKEAEAKAKEAAEKDIEATKWAEELKAYETSEEALNKKIADLNVEKEKITQANVEMAEAVKDLKEAYEEMAGEWDEDGNLLSSATEPFEFNDVTFKIDGAGLPRQFDIQWGKDKNYSYYFSYFYSDYLQALNNGSDMSKYFNLRNALQAYKEEITGWTLDENDKAWTQQNLNYLKSDRDAAKKAYEAVYASWEKAVKAYKTASTDIDPTTIAGYADLVKALEAYNAAVKVYTDAQNDQKAKEAALDNASKAVSANVTVRDKAIADAGTAETKAITAAQEAYDKEMAAIKKEVDDAVAAQTAAATNYTTVAAESDKIINDPNATATQKAEATAKKDAALKAFNDKKAVADALTAARAGKEAAAAKTQTDANKAANDTKLAAVKAANDAHKALTDAETAANKAVTDAIVVTGKAKTAFDKAYTDIQKPFDEFNKEFGIHNLNALVTAYNDVKAVKIEDVTLCNKEDLKNIVIQRSTDLYGNAYSYKPNYAFPDRLVPYADGEILKNIEADFMKNNPDAQFVPSWVIYNGLNNCGAFGQYASISKRCDAAEATLNNAEAIKKAIATVDEQLKAFEDQLAEQIATVEAAKTAYTEKNDAYEALFAEVETNLEAANTELQAITPIIDKIEAAIKVYLSYEDPTAADIEALKKALKDAYVTAQDATYSAETTLIEAKENLAAWNNGKYNAVEAAKAALAKAEAALKAAQEALTAANDELQAQIELVSKSAE